MKLSLSTLSQEVTKLCIPLMKHGHGVFSAIFLIHTAEENIAPILFVLVAGLGLKVNIRSFVVDDGLLLNLKSELYSCDYVVAA
ncbi:hypothetical protein RJT34_17129 [Clitoria ternatea]|uniref:Uncharacterized protein n=1 Tax=Clitoria ternatea TaxID=43366 RepID=A0AAN9PEH1_CLITE